MMASGGPFQVLHDNATVALINTTRTTGQIAKEDLSFLKISNPKLAKTLDKQNARLLSLARGLTRSASEGTDVRPPTLSHTESVDDEWRRVVDVVDSLLEKADVCLDEYTGVIKKQATPEQNGAGISGRSERPTKSSQPRNIPKPQLLFRNVPKNNETTLFRPLLRSKPHAIKSLEDSLGSTDSDNLSKELGHPYASEIQQSKYPSSTYVAAEPHPPRPFEGTSAVYVDTVDGVHQMLSELKEAKEIAIDVEHHDQRSYAGIVSLMQVSTRDKDWIIDTLKPWREDLQVLNEVFADPSIVKVLHGASMDIIWLQRDLGLYIVGLFDTFHAANQLGYPKRSLAFLLKKFVDFDAQKQHQLADWRIRPLSQDMLEYARADTHFLLYVFDNLRNELLQKSKEPGDLVDVVLEESKKVALQRFERSFYDSELGMGINGWYYMLIKQSAIFTKEQFAVFRAVHQWRDEVARKEDESVHYVMQNSSLYNLAREMPAEIPQLLGCIPRVSDPVRKRLTVLLSVIAKAKASGANGPEMKDVLREHPATIEYEARQAKRRKEIQPSQQPTLAEIAKRELLNLSSDDLMADASKFWGSTINESKRRKLNIVAAGRECDYHLQIPLPNLTAEVFAVDGDGEVTGSAAAAPLERPVLNEQTEPKENGTEDREVFTIKESGGPRKRKAQVLANDNVGQGKNEVQVESEEIKLDSNPEKKESKRAKRRRAKARKAAAKRGIEEEMNESGSSVVEGFQPDSDPEDPFDYTTAPSVLHAKPDPAEGPQAPVFDPYKKALNAPKGLGKARRDVAGKSATFLK